ncbi:hypothetical protein HUA74_23310 [Myxococcus sp. CA051A]|uniref:hypothetical protein n=1 Tax=unclassified Myxococcus TaxID=2648731 RepID=UPI00157B69D0|nr:MULTISPECIES: hypothetical protein [unclassified Myxococcus]NTX17074.1 hypothetical protein [Myxococcus sp. CA056]NTX35859.1 hypothetical protein [Myxococcus sp. CA033]NTX50038.1 hypothetical protein [Myxococcus sp. CA039A]NTX63588.1 hypothetical protein [Myxococcus sp. CA051A]
MGFDIRKTLNTVRTNVQKTVQDVQKTVQENKELIKGGTAVATQSAKAFGFGKDAFQQIKNIKKGAEGLLTGKNLDFVSNPTYAKGEFKGLTKLGANMKAFARHAGIPGALLSGATAVKDIRQAIRTGSKDDIISATRSTLDATKAGLTAATGGIVGGKVMGGVLGGTVFKDKLEAGKKAVDAFKSKLPNASDDVLKAVKNVATKGVFEGATASGITKAAKNVAADVAKTGGTLAEGILGSGTRQAAKAALKEVGTEVGEAALKQGAKAAGTTAAKALGRFAPGVNVAIAAVDVANAGATLMDKNASTGKKVTSVITAVGSIAAATNIPIVSQVGAAVSTVSSIVGAFF